MTSFQATGRDSRRTTRRCAKSPVSLETLEPRLLLFATSGGVWPHPELITVSFMPDGTDIGGIPSNLISTMNARWSPAVWQKEMLRGLQSYAANSNINFSIATDDGSAFGLCGGSGTDCNLQGDSNFGDVRIGGLDLGGALGIAMLPPGINGDTTAGDFFLNTTSSWNIGTSYDLYTVSAHEAGHGIALDHSSLSSAVMYGIYTGVKSNLTSDDIAGIQSVYGTRPKDGFDASDPNDTKSNATVITSYIDSNKQVTLTGLDLTSSSDVDWYKITTPSGNSGTMVVQVQSSGLSLLAPKLTVYKGSTQKGTVSGSYNSTVSISNSIGSGQNWFIKVEGAESTVFETGAYALQINMGSSSLPPVNSPNTATPVTGSGGNGSPIVPTDNGPQTEFGADAVRTGPGSGVNVGDSYGTNTSTSPERVNLASQPGLLVVPDLHVVTPTVSPGTGPASSILDELLSRDRLRASDRSSYLIDAAARLDAF